MFLVVRVAVAAASVPTQLVLVAYVLLRVFILRILRKARPVSCARVHADFSITAVRHGICTVGILRIPIWQLPYRSELSTTSLLGYHAYPQCFAGSSTPFPAGLIG
jgi:hypothetical protein